MITEENQQNTEVQKIETIRVQKSDALDALRHHVRHGDRNRLELRVSPPFKSKMKASLHSYQQGNRYPSEMEVKPLHLKTVGNNGTGVFESKDIRKLPTRLDAIEAVRNEGIEDPSEEEIGEALDIYKDVWESDMARAMNDSIVLRNGTEIEIECIDEENTG